MNCAWIRWSVMASFGRTGAIILSAPGESKATLAMGHMHIEAMIFCAATLLLAIKAHPGLESFAGGAVAR